MARAIGAAHFCAIDLPPQSFASMAAKAGFDAIGLRLFPAFAGAPFYALSDAQADDLARQIDGEGLRAEDVEFIVIGEDFDVEAVLPGLACAARIGARRVSCCGDIRDRGRLTETLVELARAAGGFGLTLDLENMGWRAVATFEDALGLVEATGEDDLGVLVDALHFFRNGGTLERLSHAPRARLGHLQLCDVRGPAPSTDAERIAEARGGRWAPGEGELPLVALLRCMPERATVSCEVPLPAGADAQTHLRRVADGGRRIVREAHPFQAASSERGAGQFATKPSALPQRLT